MASSSARRVLVVGSGAIGLRTALELVRKNVSVVLRSPHNPLQKEVCSQGAGGLWMPFHCDDPRTDRWSIETLDELYKYYNPQQISNYCGNSVENSPLVELVPTISLHRQHVGPSVNDFLQSRHEGGEAESDGRINEEETTKSNSNPLPIWTKDTRLEFQHLTIEMLWWQNQIMKLKIPSKDELLNAGYHYAWVFKPPIVDSPRMLQAMLHEIIETTNNSKNGSYLSSVENDIQIDTGHYYESVDEMIENARALNCSAVVNCTGLGSSNICSDEQMIGARGILHHYDRSTCIRRKYNDEYQTVPMIHDTCILTEDMPWGSEEEPCYLIARGDTIVVGGSYLEGDKEDQIRPNENQRLLQNAHRVGIDTDLSKPNGEWVGFRPYRPISRCEIDDGYNITENHPDNNGSDIKVVHSYGYGGSGWTVYVGCAKEATRLLGF